MPRSPMQSDFAVYTEEPVVVDAELPGTAEVVKLPRAILRSNEATSRSTKLVMTATWIMLAVLALICAIGPHIPSGE